MLALRQTTDRLGNRSGYLRLSQGKVTDFGGAGKKATWDRTREASFKQTEGSQLSKVAPIIGNGTRQPRTLGDINLLQVDAIGANRIWKTAC